MTGAIIPDDWDGETFKCYRVKWPLSGKWEAILLGQVTEPIKTSYWDPDTGDEDEAAEAAKTAYLSTIADGDIWLLECDETVLVPGFRVHKIVNQTIPSNVWTTVTWAVYWHDSNGPGFILASEVHDPGSVDLMGMWHYDVNIALDRTAQMFVRVINSTGSINLMTGVAAPDGTIALNFDADWSDLPDLPIRIQILIPGGAVVILNPEYTNWGGHYLGEGGS